jgi:AcrR family transcriptional regulator
MGKQAATEMPAAADQGGALGQGPGLAPGREPVTSSKRDRILEGMLEAIGSSGYDGTSVRTVLDLTGLYRQAFYDNFPDKDACYLEAFDYGVKRLEALVVEAAGTQSTWVGKLRAGLAALLDALDSEPDVGRALIVEVHAAGQEALEKRAEAMKRIAEFIDSARELAGNDDSPPPIAPEGIVAGIHAIVHARLATGAGDGFRELLPEFMYFAVLPYFGSEMAEAEMQSART